MPSIDISAPTDPSVNCPFDVQGPYDPTGSKETAVQVQVVVSHPNGKDYAFGPFGPKAANGPDAYDITCDNIPSSDGKLASLTASLLGADDNKELAAQTTQVAIA
jgi:hypothetical protein